MKGKKAIYCSVCVLSGFKVRCPAGLTMCLLHDRLRVIRSNPAEREVAFAFAEQDARLKTEYARYLPSVKELAVLRLLEC